MNVGDVYVSPRGRRYKVIRFEQNGRSDVVLLNESTQREDAAVSELMVPCNGWHKIGAETDGR